MQWNGDRVLDLIRSRCIAAPPFWCKLKQESKVKAKLILNVKNKKCLMIRPWSKKVTPTRIEMGYFQRFWIWGGGIGEAIKTISNLDKVSLQWVEQVRMWNKFQTATYNTDQHTISTSTSTSRYNTDGSNQCYNTDQTDGYYESRFSFHSLWCFFADRYMRWCS